MSMLQIFGIIMGASFFGAPLYAITGQVSIQVESSLSVDVTIRSDVESKELKANQSVTIAAASNASTLNVVPIQVVDKKGDVIAQRIEQLKDMPTRIVVREVSTVIIDGL